MKKEIIVIDSHKRINTTIKKIKETIIKRNIEKDNILVFVVTDDITDKNKLKRMKQILTDKLGYICEFENHYKIHENGDLIKNERV